MHATEDLSMCQPIVDEIRLFLSKLLVDLKVFQKELEWQGFHWKRKSIRAKAIQKELQIATKKFQDFEIQHGEL